MLNRTITIDCLAAWACWLVGAALAFGVWLDLIRNDAGYAGIALIALGHLISTHRTVQRLEERERRAFDLGREAGLRSIRP